MAEKGDNKKDEYTEKELTTFNIGGDKYDTFVNKKFENRKSYRPIEHDKIRAFMPGVIQKIYVKENDKVKEGTRLLVLEAMKMKNVLLAPAPGYVKSINAEVGQMVSKDFVLVELDLK